MSIDVTIIETDSTFALVGEPGGDKLLPVWCRSVVDDSALPFLVEMRVVAAETGPYASHLGVIARVGRQLRDADLRKVKVQKLVNAVSVEAAKLITNNGDGTFSMRPLPRDRVSEFHAEMDRAYGRSYNRVDDNLLQRVADAYREGGETPTRHVAEVVGVSRSTAAKYVARARKAKLLGKATKGQPGEAE